jgi:hypothetical protein
MEALRTRQDKIRFIQVRHEESAAFMACGYAKYTGRLGVCLATSGPGGIHLLNGLYDAKLDGQPVLAITGMHYHDLVGTHAQQDVDLDKLFMDVAVFNQRVMGPNHVVPLTDLACRTALSYRGVAHISFPVDLQEEEVSKSEASKRGRAVPDLGRVGRSGARARRGGPEARRRCAERGEQDRDPRRAGRAQGHRRTRADGRGSRRARSLRRCSAKPRFPTTAPILPAASACWGRSPRRRPWRTATPC